MKIKAHLIVIGLALAMPPAAAQELDTSQLEQSADYERNRILVRSTMRQKQRYDASRSTGVTAGQIKACANKAAFRARHGADDPRIRLLYDKCAKIGR
jgi:hypothetical protein